MNCAQLSRRANELKKQLSEGQGDTRVIRYNLQNVYRELLLTDLEYALDKKLEQELWNNIFKNHVSSLQAKVRDKMNPKRSELQSMLTLTLDSATGFFLQLLHELCSAFDLELPFCVKAARFGVTKKLRQRFQKVVIPQISSCLYICQYCLVHLGDLARYRNDTDQAHMYYNHAVTLIPTNGQPYNQLAIVSASKSDQLSMAFYYIRSIAVKHPFPAALTNLQSTFSKLVDRDEMKIFKMRDVELIHYFIKFHAVIYMAGGEADLQIASTIKTKLEENFRDHLSQESLTARQLVQIMAINIFALCSIRQLDENGALPNKKNEDGPSDHDHLADTADEEQCWKLTLDLTLTLSQLLLYHTPISPKEGRAWHGLAAIGVLLEWLQHHPKLLTDETVSGKYLFWNRLGKLLSVLSQLPETNRPNQSTLWEDLLLNGFRPLQEAHSELDFSSSRAKHLTKEEGNSARVMRIIKSGAELASLQPSLLLMKKGDPVSFSSPQHDAQAELDKTLHPRSSKAAALALRRKIQQVRGPRNSLGYDTVPSNLDGEDADDDEDDEEDEEDDDGDDEFEEMEKMTVGTQVIEPKPSSKTNSQDAPKERNRVSFKLEKNMVIPPPTVSKQPHQPSPPNHPSQQNRPHFPPHMPRGYPVHYPRQGPPQQMAPHQGTYPPPSGWNPPTMPPRPQFQNFRNPRPPQQALGPQGGPSHGPHMTHGPPMHHGPQQHHGPQPPHGPSVPHGPQAPHGGQHMPPQMWQQQQQPPPPQSRHMPPFMGNQTGPRYSGPLPAQNRQSMSPQNYTNPQQQISRESPVEGEQSHESFPSQPWNTQMMPPGRGFVRNGPMRIPQEEGRMLDPPEREPSRQFDKRSRGMAQFRAQPQEFNPSSYPDVPPRSPFGLDNGQAKSPFGHLERNGPIGKQGVDMFYDQRGTKEDDQVGFMNFLNNMPQGEMDGGQHQRGTNLRQSSAMEPPNYQKNFFNSDYQRKSSGDDFGTFSPHQLPSPNARSPSQGFFDDNSFGARQPNGELPRQRKNGSPWNDPQASSSFMSSQQQQQQQQPSQMSPAMSKQDEPLALLQQLMTPPLSESTAVSRSSWSLGTDERLTQNNESTGFAAGGRTNRTPPFGPSWPPDSPGSWAGGQELQFGDPSSPQELLNQDGSGGGSSRVIGTRRQSGSLTADSDGTNFFSGSDSSYSLFSSPSPWSDKSKRDSLGGTSPFGSLHPREDDKQGTSSNLFGGLGWSIPPSDQISGSPTSTLLPERIQSIWSSPASSGGVEPPNMDKLLRDKPET